MKHVQPDVRCPSLNCGRVADNVDLYEKDLPGTRWRKALAALVNAPMRLHRYRHFHAEVVEDAIRAYDCRLSCRDDT